MLTLKRGEQPGTPVPLGGELRVGSERAYHSGRVEAAPSRPEGRPSALVIPRGRQSALQAQVHTGESPPPYGAWHCEAPGWNPLL